MKHKMKANLFRIHYLLCCHCNIFHIPILVEPFDYSSIIKSRNEKIDKACCFPIFFCNYLFCLIIHIENWGCQSFSSIMFESMKDTNRSHVKVFNYLLIPYKIVMQILEKKICLPQSIRNSIIDIVIVDYSCCISAILILFWTISNYHIFILLNFPQRNNIKVKIGNIVRLSTCIFEFHQFCLSIFRILSQIKCPKFYFCFMFILEPRDH